MKWPIVKALALLVVVAPLAACHDAHTLDVGAQAEYHGATGVPLKDATPLESKSCNPEQTPSPDPNSSDSV